MGQNPAQGEEEIEGYRREDEEESSWGDYPIDTLLIRNEPRTVHDVLRRIKQGTYVMDPDFQRDFVWDVKKQSKLIESVLLRIPLPVFYIAENREGKMVVVDGLQRLSTFRRFCENEFHLRLPDRQDLDKKLFRDLPPKLQNRIEDCNLILYIIDSKVPTRALLDIFERVNSGVALTRQQMRNCLHTGPATRFLKEEAAIDLFKDATGNSLTPLKMLDREMINRFCGFQVLGLDAYEGQMDDFLARTLEEMNRRATEAFFGDLRIKLRRTLTNNLRAFGRHAFRKQIRGRDARIVFNASIWDTMSFHMAELDEDWVANNAETIGSAFLDLLDNPEFRDSISLGTSQQNRVRDRFRMVKEMFERLRMDGLPH
ncbi:MAG: hypothetical protein RLY86_3606 [Pseudomonadota bacterium]|jgi:hypothetical protein